VLPELAHAINSFFQADKPIGFICVSPIIGAIVLGRKGIELTIGNNRRIVSDIEALGAKNVITSVEEAIVSTHGKIVSTAAYMLGPSIKDVAKGIDDLVRKVIELC
jgi:enhancing lycopene biosynthesis protein 2